MARIRRPALALGVLAVSGLLLAGCTANGGGWIQSATGAKKATFGFTWQGDEYFIGVDPTLAKGFWSDGYVKFRIADGGITFGDFGDCIEGDGQYVSTNRNWSGSGTIEIEICDEGEPGPTEGDYIDVDLSGGPYDGYSNGGTLEGGNLKVKSEEN